MLIIGSPPVHGFLGLAEQQSQARPDHCWAEGLTKSPLLLKQCPSCFRSKTHGFQRRSFLTHTKHTDILENTNAWAVRTGEKPIQNNTAPPKGREAATRNSPKALTPREVPRRLPRAYPGEERRNWQAFKHHIRETQSGMRDDEVVCRKPRQNQGLAVITLQATA